MIPVMFHLAQNSLAGLAKQRRVRGFLCLFIEWFVLGALPVLSDCASGSQVGYTEGIERFCSAGPKLHAAMLIFCNGRTRLDRYQILSFVE